VTLLLVGSSTAAIGFPPAMELLRARGGAVDAVVAAVAAVEANPDDHSVGYGGLPNLLGEVELDASLMDGATLACRLGRRPRRLPGRNRPRPRCHGVAAARAGRRCRRGSACAEARLEPIDLLTPEAERIWRSRLDDRLPGDSAYLARVRDLVAGLARDPSTRTRTRCCPPTPPRLRSLLRTRPAPRPQDRSGCRTMSTGPSTSSPATRRDISPAASAPRAGPGSTRAGWETPRSSAPATTPTTASAPPPAPAGARWRSASAPPTRSSWRCASAARSTTP
jgi:hypothetical protein